MSEDFNCSVHFCISTGPILITILVVLPCIGFTLYKYIHPVIIIKLGGCKFYKISIFFVFDIRLVFDSILNIFLNLPRT